MHKIKNIQYTIYKKKIWIYRKVSKLLCRFEYFWWIGFQKFHQVGVMFLSLYTMIKVFCISNFSLTFQLENEEYIDWFLMLYQIELGVFKCFIYQPNLMLLCFVLHSQIKIQRFSIIYKIYIPLQYWPCVIVDKL